MYCLRSMTERRQQICGALKASYVCIVAVMIFSWLITRRFFMGLGDLFGRRHHKRPKYEGSTLAKHGYGEFIISVPFFAKEVDCMFSDRAPRNAA